MVKKHDRNLGLCLVSSSGGNWEQLQTLQPLIEKYNGVFVTEKPQPPRKSRFFLILE